MHENYSEVVLILIISSALILLLGTILVIGLLIQQKRKLNQQQQLTEIKNRHEKSLLESRLKIQEEDGKVTEDTYDWYAQDKQGNVWYFGESTKALDNGIWSTEGSWEAGVKGARQGIIMYGNPKAHIGEVYYEEFWYQHAEDQAEVVNTNSTAKVAYGTFNNCVKTKEFTRLTPDEIENKYFAAGVGQILAVVTITGGGSEREELISITH